MSDMLDAEAEYIPLLSSEDEELMNNEDIPDALLYYLCVTRFCFPVWLFLLR